jgi:CBS domain containing-hemolysin-like protein
MAIQRSEKVTLMIALPLRLFYIIFKPFIWLLNHFANFILKLSGFPPINEAEQLHSPDEIRYILDESSKSGIIENADHVLINNIFEFADKDVKQVMVPRGRIVAVEKSQVFGDIVNKFINEGYSRIPVYDVSIDNITGILNAKDIIQAQADIDLKSIDEYIRKAFFVNEDELLKGVLSKMLKNKIHMLIVLDEFGGVAGLVTMEDIIEEIIGEIQDEFDDESPLIEKLSNNEYIIGAQAVISDLNKHLPVPLPESENYETLGGLIMSVAGVIPNINKVIELENYSCKILARSDRLIEKIKITLKQIEEINE